MHGIWYKYKPLVAMVTGSLDTCSVLLVAVRAACTMQVKVVNVKANNSAIFCPILKILGSRIMYFSRRIQWLQN